MVNNVVAAVSGALHGVFGDGYRYYQDPVSQGAVPPCFYLGLLEPSVKLQLGRRFRLDVPMAIQYFPERENSCLELTGVAERLPAALEVIELPGGPVRGREMRWRMENGVLCFFVTYTVFLVSQKEQADMEELTVAAGV